mgnify:FL=1
MTCPMARKGANRPDFHPWRMAAIAAAMLLGGAAALPGGALALSELPQENLPPPEDVENADTIERRDLPPPGAEAEGEAQEPDASEQPSAPAEQSARPAMNVPLPDPVVIPRDPEGATPAEAAEDDDEPVPDVLYDLSLLPEPVRRMRDLIVEACLSGDIERLRPLVSTGENATQLSFGDVAGDPVAFLRELSGDEEGHEILAILYEVLTAGYVRMGEGTPQEMYVWPYFFAVPLDALTAPQRVELFKIVTAGDYEDMKNYGAYIFYRTGISPEGRWLFFVAGD